MLPFINYPFELLSGILGSSPDEIKLIFSFLFSYPLAGALKRIPDNRPDVKNGFIISCGLFYLVGLYSLWSGLRDIAISAGVTYALAHFLRKSSYMPWLTFFFLMGHMAVNQLRRQFDANPAVIDITGTQMVLVMKLSAFAWNVADGTLSDELLSDHQKDRRIKTLPSFLDYTGYVMFFPSLMVGPSFDYNEYKRWLDLSMFQVPADMDPLKRPATKKKRKIPRSLAPAMWKLASGLGWILLFLQTSGWFYPELLLEDRFLQFGFLHRLIAAYMIMMTVRFKFYGAWTLAEGACILTGLGYNGVDTVTGKVDWSRLQNVDPWALETAQNSRAYLGNWNMNTNNWLRNYIYFRVTPRGKKPGFRASMATFVTSAFWHGFYPGYYLTFVLASFIQTAAKNFRRLARPFFLDPVSQKPLPNKKFYDFASWFATHAIFTFCTIPFVILHMDASWEVWRRLYFYGIVGTLASIGVFSSPLKSKLRKMLEVRSKAAGVGPMRHTASTDSIPGRRAEPVYGMNDPVKDIDDAIQEIKGEIEKQQTTTGKEEESKKTA